jgi:hypothetical protein
VAPADFERFLSMNMAIPPLDDIHVRKAINFAIDKKELLDVVEREAERSAAVATHIALDSQEENLLASYDPYETTAHGGDLEAAKAEMARSRYDRNHDGICDAPACSGIRMLVKQSDPVRVAASPLIRAAVSRIGLRLKLDLRDDDAWFEATRDAGPAKIAINFFGISKDFPSASYLFPGLGSTKLRHNQSPDQSLVGATPTELRRWGYRITEVPNVDGRIEQCAALLFEAQVRCWAELDQYLMEQVVPWVPLWAEQTGRIVSLRVAMFSLDQANEVVEPALDQITLTAAARSEPAPEPSISPSPSVGSPIPDGTYTFSLGRRDGTRFGLGENADAEDPCNFGMLTIHLSRGHWRFTRASADCPVGASSGIYYGTGTTVTFVTQLPLQDTLTQSPVSWSFDGGALHFKLTACTGPAAEDPVLCKVERMYFEAQPWKKIEP